ncbi:hypothetical protein SASPL_119834 [Salvia splendens]|uniref:Uncharacterized protein n=1 Tax=Salvia splendens TaxID=180675 RepID=A0A8X8XT45_SALSN|nr:hypothetical protein SASPL_119834 [Salvia splendens]
MPPISRSSALVLVSLRINFTYAAIVSVMFLMNQAPRVVMASNITYVAPPAAKSSSEEGGLVKGVVTYMVMDDLMIKPMCTISSITMLIKFNVKEVGALEEKLVTLGMNEAVKLLKTSVQSKKVLTDVFI